MHVLQVPSWYPDDANPLGGSFFRDQTHMLRDGGLEVGVCSVAHTHLARWVRGGGATVSREDGVVVVRGVVPTMPGKVQVMEGAVVRRLARRALAAYEREAGVPDVVHAHSVLPAVHVAAEASRRWGVPYVLTEHRPWSLTVPRTGGRFAGIRGAVRGASGLATVSTAIASELAAHYGTPPWDVIALPVPDAFFAEPLRARNADDEVVLTHISHLDVNKRPELTLRAFATVHRRVPRTRLRIVGGSPLRVEELSAVAAELGISDHVELPGRLPRQEVAGVLASSDVFVLASAVEAGGTVLSEAQACGVPVVATRTWAGQFSVEPGTGLLVDVDDEAGLADALTHMVRHLDDFPRESIRARARQRFSASTFVGASTDLYERALAGTRPAADVP
ncbi:glycosyltransferase [Georgenia sp. EYE_87]|uniref:glycosyltransferase n=1 Tax=Georgenia sp. EYE_87 TaxID=2853448 RepID=UPI0020042F5F|nr:glycosyltransferase [Georgenia sp. EYE_87]MCK6211762.1 glycosyltransferase [Georgenia sp. EYE_87]